jgi:hypothetical protein
MSNHLKSEAIDYNRLMQANLTRVFNERDAGRRIVGDPRALCRGCRAVRAGRLR